MEKDIIVRLHNNFERSIYKQQGTDMEFWLARDLQNLLGYARWENFAKVVEKAKTACKTAGFEVTDHFLDITKKVSLGSGAERQIGDIALTRYACYLIAQNGDPSKDQIAFAQTYFAVQTRKQEIIEQRITEIERLSARRKLSLSEKELSGIIYERLSDEKSFARIRSKGDTALFGGKTTKQMKQKLDIPKSRALADFLPTITIKAKDFANEITNFNIKRDDLRTESGITKEHVKNNQEVRKLLIKRNIKPEALPPADDVKKVERKLASEQKKLITKAEPLDVKQDEQSL
ncbi:MAG: DNA damage-inducible protein D [Sedimentisphaerales bacterium]|nr:DNA damage-inducible protein D [Sedimentisphaerales bacterium]